MKNTFFKDAKVGAITGFGLATNYAVISLIISEFYLPSYDPSILSVFKWDSFFLPILCGMSIFGILLSSAIGGITSAIFGFILKFFHWQKHNFILTCTFLSLVPSGSYAIAIILFLLSSRYGTSHLLIFILDFQLAGIILLLFPSIIYVITSALASRHLYNQFTQSSNAISPSP